MVHDKMIYLSFVCFHLQVYILPVVVSGGTAVVTTSFFGGQKNIQLSTDFADDPVPADLFTEIRVVYVK